MSHPRNRRPARLRRLAIAIALVLLDSGSGQAAEARIAVAANFTETANAIGAQYAKESGHRVRYSFGSTGQLYAQIGQAAPFDVFLSADRERPQAAIAAGFAVPGSAFTYALGTLVLYSRNKALVTGPAVLTQSRFAKIAIANPLTAPYGAAAMDVLKRLGLQDRLAANIVRGNNVAQAYQFIATGNAELGFVALAQIYRHADGSRWIVPAVMHRPIAQDAALLKPGESNPAARDFLAFLRGPQARQIIRASGYDTPEQ